MMTLSPTMGEAERMAAAGRHGGFPAKPEQVLEDLAALAAQICEMPSALISCPEENRQRVKSERGSGNGRDGLGNLILCPFAGSAGFVFAGAGCRAG